MQQPVAPTEQKRPAQQQEHEHHPVNATARAASPQQQQPSKVSVRPRQLMQMYLDVGQRDFHASRCPCCGMLYCRGEESDERLHAAFHATATKGLKYGSGGTGDRVVLTDGAAGCVVKLSGSEAVRNKKVRLEGVVSTATGAGWVFNHRRMLC